MSFEMAEQLKASLTDKWVVVDAGIPELRRFSGRTGKVKTVNMNCRALVEFDGMADIGWYDIATSCLTVVDSPAPKAKPAAEEKPAAKAPAKAAGASPLEMARKQGATGAAAKPAGGASPLEMARKQGAGAAASTESGGKKLSPLEMARKQGAGGSAAAGSAAASAPAADPAPAPAAAEDAPAEPKKPAAKPAGTMSPLDMIRKQGPAKS